MININTLKVGDTIVCINSYKIKEGGYIFKYEMNDKWKIIKINPSDWVYRIRAITEKIIGYNSFTLEEMENWINLAEWREQQINSIFEDE